MSSENNDDPLELYQQALDQIDDLYQVAEAIGDDGAQQTLENIRNEFEQQKNQYEGDYFDLDQSTTAAFQDINNRLGGLEESLDGVEDLQETVNDLEERVGELEQGDTDTTAGTSTRRKVVYSLSGLGILGLVGGIIDYLNVTPEDSSCGGELARFSDEPSGDFDGLGYLYEQEPCGELEVLPGYALDLEEFDAGIIAANNTGKQVIDEVAEVYKHLSEDRYPKLKQYGISLDAAVDPSLSQDVVLGFDDDRNLVQLDTVVKLGGYDPEDILGSYDTGELVIEDTFSDGAYEQAKEIGKNRAIHNDVGGVIGW